MTLQMTSRFDILMRFGSFLLSSVHVIARDSQHVSLASGAQQPDAGITAEQSFTDGASTASGAKR